ncbi:MAG: thiamine phosphate synthase [Candidatus Omnitrophica bacterium]|nr:thiamine phosphate synthase [Candidatus Omnitrophota bacterium]
MREFNLYAIIDRLSSKSKDLVEIAEALCKGGADVIQLREKTLSTKELIKAGLKIRRITRKFDTLLMVNDRIDVAYAIGADGVHLGQEDLPIEFARKIFDGRKTIGISTHSLRQALLAQRNGADYIGVGPIFATPTKPEYKPVGLKFIREVRNYIKIPFVAIGGIDEENLEEVIKAGASRVAVVRVLMNTEDICNTTRTFKEKLMLLVKKYKR